MLLLLLLLLTIFSSDGVMRSPQCPRQEILHPCTCDREGINCNSATTPAQLRRVFSSPPLHENRFRSLWMHGTPLQTLESKTFGVVSFVSVSIRHNAIASMGDDVFAGSVAWLRELDLSHNLLRSIPFPSLDGLVALEELRLHHNHITGLPHHAFGNLSRLHAIDLSHNDIDHVGEFAFSALPRLGHLDLTRNKLTRVGRHALHTRHPETKLTFLGLAYNEVSSVDADAFSGMAASFGEIILAFNQMQTMDEKGFAPLVHRLQRHAEGHVLLLGNPVRCDVRLGWLLDLSEDTLTRILGVSCNGKPLQRIDLEDLLPHPDASDSAEASHGELLR